MGGGSGVDTPALAVEFQTGEQTSMLSLRIPLQRFADAYFADDVFARTMKSIQRGLGFFFGAVFKLGKFEATLTVEFVFDDVLGRLGHGRTCLSSCLGVTQLSFVLERRMILMV